MSPAPGILPGRRPCGPCYNASSASYSDFLSFLIPITASNLNVFVAIRSSATSFCFIFVSSAIDVPLSHPLECPIAPLSRYRGCRNRKARVRVTPVPIRRFVETRKRDISSSSICRTIAESRSLKGRLKSTREFHAVCTLAFVSFA